MKDNFTELVFIIDRSGSMSGLESDTIGGFNSTISKQKELEGEAVVSTILFNNEIVTLHDRVPLGSIGEMTKKDYFASGGTALLDAVGHTVNHIRGVHAGISEEERPKNTLVVIITDGYENASREYNHRSVKRLIEKQKEEGWEFLFLGANIDVAEEAERMGIDARDAVEYDCSKEGLKECYGVIVNACRCVRSPDFPDEE